MQKNHEVIGITGNSGIIIDKLGARIDEKQARQLNILTLAYLGDCIHDLYIRSRICSKGADRRINAIHKDTVGYVSANSQADCLDFVLDDFSETELAVYKRGRNSKSVPTKNTDKAHYSKATGLEAVFGYLYVSGQDDRLTFILNKCYNYLHEGRKEFWDKQG